MASADLLNKITTEHNKADDPAQLAHEQLIATWQAPTWGDYQEKHFSRRVFAFFFRKNGVHLATAVKMYHHYSYSEKLK